MFCCQQDEAWGNVFWNHWGDTQAQASRESRKGIQREQEYEEIMPPGRTRVDVFKTNQSRKLAARPRHPQYYNVMSRGDKIYKVEGQKLSKKKLEDMENNEQKAGGRKEKKTRSMDRLTTTRNTRTKGEHGSK